LKKKRASKSKAVDQQLGRLAASVEAGISMRFAEEVSDAGSLTGHGKQLLRGIDHCIRETLVHSTNETKQRKELSWSIQVVYENLLNSEPERLI
jgi:hypothetical protein